MKDNRKGDRARHLAIVHSQREVHRSRRHRLLEKFLRSELVTVWEWVEVLVVLVWLLGLLAGVGWILEYISPQGL